jgi:hypothetical protein
MGNVKNNIDSTDVMASMYVLERHLKKATLFISFIIWFKTQGRLIINIFGSILGIALSSLLILYVYTDNKLYLNVFTLTIGSSMILMFILFIIESITNYLMGVKNNKSFKDMSRMTAPDKDDINIALFKNTEPKKYKVNDEKDKLAHNKQLFLYPVYARMNPNGTMSFFRKEQLEEVNPL